MSRSERGSRSDTSSPAARSDDLPPLSRYKSTEMIKTKHEEKHAKRKGSQEKVPSYMKQTVASLHKRQSFRYSGDLSRGRLPKRRTQSLDPEMSQLLDREKERRNRSFRPPLEMISDESSNSGSLENYLVDAEDDAPVDLEKLREDVERAYNETFSDVRRLRRNSTGNSRRIEGGVSPLPSRASDHLTDGEEILVDAHSHDVDVRPHSATEISMPFRRNAFDRDATEATDELPMPVQVAPLDIQLANELTPEEREFNSRPSAFTQSGSFDSTAAITTSPQPRALSPYLEDPKRPAADQKLSRSHLDHTLPQNVQETKDVSAEAESSDGSRGNAEVRCQSGAVISGSPPSGGYVQITEEKRHEVRRPSDIHNKPNIKKSLILAGIFAGVAIIIGKIFSSRD